MILLPRVADQGPHDLVTLVDDPKLYDLVTEGCGPGLMILLPRVADLAK